MRIAAENLVPGAKVTDVARRHDVTRWQVYDWRKKLMVGAHGTAFSDMPGMHHGFGCPVLRKCGYSARDAGHKRQRGEPLQFLRLGFLVGHGLRLIHRAPQDEWERSLHQDRRELYCGLQLIGA